MVDDDAQAAEYEAMVRDFWGTLYQAEMHLWHQRPKEAYEVIRATRRRYIRKVEAQWSVVSGELSAISPTISPGRRANRSLLRRALAAFGIARDEREAVPR